MPYQLWLKNAVTEESRRVAETAEWDEITKYMWTEGNFACDCNRHLFFERAKGIEPEEEELSCLTNNYKLMVYNPNLIMIWDERDIVDDEYNPHEDAKD